MIIDANLPIYAVDEESRHHAAAKEWFLGELNGGDVIGFALVTLIAFVRLVTNQRLLVAAFTVPEAVGLVQGWLALPNVRILVPTDRHWAVLAELGTSGQARGPLVTDAHLAALAIEHGATLATNDRGFARFPKLKVRYPLAG